MSTASTTATVFRAERWRIALTYGVTLLENLFYLLYPWTIGLAIDGLLAGRGLRALAPLVVIWFLHIAVGAARQVYDTRVFARVHAGIATGTIARQRTAGVDTTEIAARSAMSRELVDFFEREVPTLITASLGLVGGIAMLFWYDWLIGLIVTVWMAPVLVIYAIMGRRAHRLNKDLNDETEREVDLINRSRFGPLASHFRRRGRLRVRLSNTEAASWALVELFSITAVVLVILRMTALPGHPGRRALRHAGLCLAGARMPGPGPAAGPALRAAPRHPPPAGTGWRRAGGAVIMAGRCRGGTRGPR